MCLQKYVAGVRLKSMAKEERAPLISSDRDKAIVWGLAALFIVWLLSGDFLTGAIGGAGVGAGRFGLAKLRKSKKTKTA